MQVFLLFINYLKYVLVLKNSGKYWRNKKFIKRSGKIKVEIFPIIEEIEKKEVFIETINKLFY